MTAVDLLPPETAENQTESRIDDVEQAFAKILEKEPDEESSIRCKEIVLVGGPEIEGQQLEVIDARDVGRFEVYFKLTEAHVGFAKQQIEHQAMPGQMFFTEKDTGEPIYVGGFKFAALETVVDEQTSIVMSTPDEHGFEAQSFKGMVKIEINMQEQGSSREAALHLQSALERLGLAHILEQPEDAGLDSYKLARLKWLHDLDDETLQEVKETVQHMRRQEVAPGYVTLVDPGRHEDYEEHWGRQAVFHELPQDSIVDVIKNGALLSTLERYKRGLSAAGRSSHGDIATGGADAVFTFCKTEEKRTDPGRAIKFASDEASIIRPTMIIDSSVLDRTDMYMYNYDAHGSTETTKWQERSRPEEFFPHGRGIHELDFRTGIGIEYVNAIACSDDQQRQEIIEELTSAGITEVNGVPLEQFVVVPRYRKDIVELAHRS